ncbi:type I 3-dehydroquinate dehydratase [Staphylococcus hyicus]|uniref:3-dehydroquinate dehydratase n=2 Tax=Staphylococcus hyicus TaxID=1284 RepID=A0A418JM29_STAHY|nr:type I 3-dehydroquinate dehydratase [Staphylococcus hyicus]MDP4448757.1 type I 3-dehydroquinate dehydratase [Staphylococcus hyicus]NJH81494.1 type I 3-dehydroquinate dehydratase [Staphylococcus hyicus]NJH99798.1 type I 3-dehydroquinate dehydratase [Staphylococcus hyicus]NJI31943.1 type I 3-dehydroquinate dehydratase [Staphylococcus hyicus]RIO47618.1 type I 3-dehydroquinate dehydratase [Staphylococcus hyicus]
MKAQIVGSFMVVSHVLSQNEIQLIKMQESNIDILELRIDALQDVASADVAQIIQQLKDEGFQSEILVTFRSQMQGGKGNCDEKEYQSLLTQLAELKNVDYIDVEWEPSIGRHHIVRTIQSHGIDVIVSYHNFHETPQLDVLKKTYYHMSQYGGAHLKIAVMPQSKQDVLTLLQAVSEASDALQHWVTGISMSHLGIISRTAQQTFGGALSYGAINESVAPGQLNVKTLKNAMAVYQ